MVWICSRGGWMYNLGSLVSLRSQASAVFKSWELIDFCVHETHNSTVQYNTLSTFESKEPNVITD